MQDRYPAAGFFIRPYFLRRYPGSANWYVAWFDPATKQTRRTTLETPDLEAAKAAAAKLVAIHGDLRDARPDEVTLQQVFDRYQEHHGKAVRSCREQERHLRYWGEFFGVSASVADVTPPRQHALVERLKGRGYSSGTVKRILASGAAALRWAYRRGELLTVPHIVTCPTANPGSACSRPPRSRRCGTLRRNRICSSCGAT